MVSRSALLTSLALMWQWPRNSSKTPLASYFRISSVQCAFNLLTSLLISSSQGTLPFFSFMKIVLSLLLLACFYLVAYVVGKRFQEALDACNQALRLDPHNAFAYITKGAVLNNMGRPEEALAACNEALRLDSYSAYAYSTKAAALGPLGRFQEALGACDQALRLDPNNAAAHGVAGGALIGLQRHQEAWRAIERALQLDPSDAQSYFNRGQVFLKFKRYQEALTAYDQALRLGMTNPILAIYLSRGVAYWNLGSLGAALYSIDEGLRRDPSSPQAPMAYQIRSEISKELR
jgi:tetratricopeptide (TPR) repeat protein